jgi:hypothetical protein
VVVLIGLGVTPGRAPDSRRVLDEHQDHAGEALSQFGGIIRRREEMDFSVLVELDAQVVDDHRPRSASITTSRARHDATGGRRCIVRA